MDALISVDRWALDDDTNCPPNSIAPFCSTSLIHQMILICSYLCHIVLDLQCNYPSFSL